MNLNGFPAGVFIENREIRPHLGGVLDTSLIPRQARDDGLLDRHVELFENTTRVAQMEAGVADHVWSLEEEVALLN